MADPTGGWDPALIGVVKGIAIVVIAVGLLQAFSYVLQIVVAIISLRRRSPQISFGFAWDILSELSPPISVIVPAYNEEATIIDNLHALLALEYPDFEILVINDGSTDATLETLISNFGLKQTVRAHDPVLPHEPLRAVYTSPEVSRLVVADKENGGSKADAMNLGINLSRTPLFCAIDADSILEPDALLQAAYPLIYDTRNFVASGGTIAIANGCTIVGGRITKVGLSKSLLAKFQVVEYLRSFLIGRLAWDHLNALSLISGAFGVFRRDAVIEVGGYHRGSLGEDLELIVAIHQNMREKKQPYMIRFTAAPVCWTQVPEDLSSLAKQRIRWQRGALETLFRHARMILNPKYGRFGVLGMGNVLISDLLGPVAELAGYLLLPAFVIFDMLNIQYMIAFFALSVSFGIFFSVMSLLIEDVEFGRYASVKNLAHMLLAAILENLGYRQLNNVFRIVGTWQYLIGAKAVWEPPSRKKFGG